MNEALNALYELQKVDSALAIAQKQFRSLDSGKNERAIAESARAVHERLSRATQETHSDLQDSELELKTVEAKKKDFEGKLYGGRVTAFKELENMQHEIEALGRQRDRLDERILTLMDQLEQRRREEAEAKAALEAADKALADKEAAYRTAARKLQVRAKTLMEEREEKLKPVPPALLKRYDSLRPLKAGVAVARIDEERRCAACHTSLPSNLIESVRSTERVETCENCGRLLCVGTA